MAISDAQAHERFGMSKADAHRVRDTALQGLSPAQVAAARAAWTDMAALVRASSRHPELIRFYFLNALANGEGVADAETQTRAFARG